MKRLAFLTVIALQADPEAVTQLQVHHAQAKAALRATFSQSSPKISSPKPAVFFDGLNSAALAFHTDDFLQIGDALAHLPSLNAASPVVNTALLCGTLLAGIGLRWISKRGLAAAQLDYDKAIQAALVAETGLAEKKLHDELVGKFTLLMDADQQTALEQVYHIHDLKDQIAALQTELSSAHEQATQESTGPEAVVKQQALLKIDLTKHENLLNGITKLLDAQTPQSQVK